MIGPHYGGGSDFTWEDIEKNLWKSSGKALVHKAETFVKVQVERNHDSYKKVEPERGWCYIGIHL